MTPAEKAWLFGQIWSLPDSDQPGERRAALDKLATLRAKMAWPSFGDMLRRGIAHYVNARVNKRRAIYRLSRPEASHCDASVLRYTCDFATEVQATQWQIPYC